MNFADYPESVAELKCDNGAGWSPRDALINLLRDIDSGKIAPKSLVICGYEVLGKGRTATFFRNASPTIQDAVGLMEVAKADMLRKD